MSRMICLEIMARNDCYVPSLDVCESLGEMNHVIFRSTAGESGNVGLKHLAGM